MHCWWIYLCGLQAWNLTGDAFTKGPGDKPWISEMYGYSYGTAAADVWHKVIQSAHMYPGYFTTGTSREHVVPQNALCSFFCRTFEHDGELGHFLLSMHMHSGCND